MAKSCYHSSTFPDLRCFRLFYRKTNKQKKKSNKTINPALIDSWHYNIGIMTLSSFSRGWEVSRFKTLELLSLLKGELEGVLA